MPELLNLSSDELLTTTRSVRKRLDLERPVPMDLVRECIEIATQAPTGSNRQAWHWIVVTDEAKRRALAAMYARAWELYKKMPIFVDGTNSGDSERDATQRRVLSSAEYLVEHLGEVPVLVIPSIEGRIDDLPPSLSAGFWGSLFPAGWSFCLAARARGLGTAWTTLHLMFEAEAAELLGIPYAEVSQGALFPVAYTLGTHFKPGPRRDLASILHVDAW
jgi:nitroreductase